MGHLTLVAIITIGMVVAGTVEVVENVDENKTSEFARFKDGMTRLMRVPHSEIKSTLDEEQKVCSRKRTQKSKIAAFRDLNAKD